MAKPLTPAQRAGLRIPHIRRGLARGLTTREIQRQFRGTRLAVRRQTLLREIRPFQQALRYSPQIQRLPRERLIPDYMHTSPGRWLERTYKYDARITWWDEIKGEWHEVYQSVSSDYRMRKSEIQDRIAGWLRGRYGAPNISNIKVEPLYAYKWRG